MRVKKKKDPVKILSIRSTEYCTHDCGFNSLWGMIIVSSHLLYSLLVCFDTLIFLSLVGLFISADNHQNRRELHFMREDRTFSKFGVLRLRFF